MSQVTATTTNIPVINIYSRAITMTVALVPTAVDPAAQGQNDVVHLLHLMPRDTMRGLLTLPLYYSSNSLSPRCLLRLMPTETFNPEASQGRKLSKV